MQKHNRQPLSTRGYIVKYFVLTTAFLLALGAAAPAFAIEVLVNGHPGAAQHERSSTLAGSPVRSLQSQSQLSELPEPEVFAMMLLGLVLIGYRASRDSSEKFK